MSGAALFITLIVVGVVVALLAIHEIGKDEAMREALDQERAFDEPIYVRPCNDAQLDRLRDRIHEVGILRVADVEIRTGRHSRIVDQYHVFVIDSLGAVHDVIQTEHRQEAVDIAIKLARHWNVELIDRERIVG